LFEYSIFVWNADEEVTIGERDRSVILERAEDTDSNDLESLTKEWLVREEGRRKRTEAGEGFQKLLEAGGTT
jgi:hypothetical protein